MEKIIDFLMGWSGLAVAFYIIADCALVIQNEYMFVLFIGLMTFVISLLTISFKQLRVEKDNLQNCVEKLQDKIEQLEKN